MKFNRKKDPVRLAVICLAAVLMAVNIKSFVRTGGLYPGGANGLNLLGVAQGPQRMVKGLIIVVAVIIDVLRRRAAESAR